jgi:hypothetical protein
VIVQGIQWGSAVSVYLQTGDPQAEWAAELERRRSTNPGENSAAMEPAAISGFDELRMRLELPAYWLLGQRLPGWRTRSVESDQLVEIRDYAAALRSCADDLFSGDLSALPELFASYAEHRRQEDSRDRREMAVRIAQDIVREAERPRTVLEQVKIVQGIRSTIGYLRTECRVLLKALGKSLEASSLIRFVESWRARGESLEAELAEFVYVQGLEATPRIVEGLRNAQETATVVQAALASGQADRALMERVATLDHLSKELILALDLALEALSHA